MDMFSVGKHVWGWYLHLDYGYQIAAGIGGAAAAIALAVFGVVLGRALLIAIERACYGTIQSIPYMAEAAADAICDGFLRIARELGTILNVLLGLALSPIVHAWEILWEALSWLIDGAVSKRERRTELKALWKAEYQHEYRSFRAFCRYFEQKSQDNPAPPQPDEQVFDDAFDDSASPLEDPLEAACRFMNLSPDGNFTKREFEARYRELMSAYHPDKPTGSHDLTCALNNARAEIRSAKGWR